MENGFEYERTVRSTSVMDEPAAALAPLLRPGDIVMLNGDLGAGKTRFVQGVARALGIREDITSPTFTILISYEAPAFPLNHFDLYRLDEPEDLDDIGYWDVLEGGGATFVEWADKFPGEYPEDCLEMHVSVDDEGVRTVRVRARGERGNELLEQWAADERAGWNRPA